MSWFGQFYLDKEKDIVVDLDLRGDGELHYALRTPHHHTGNLITNLAGLCDLPLGLDDDGLKIIRGTIPCYIDGYNQRIYIFRLGNTKVANIYPDGRIEMKASIPAIAKTLMSQTKKYKLPIAKSIVKTYIPSECKFETDVHTHMNGNLDPEALVALGLFHQIRYPFYYIKKLELRCTEDQLDRLNRQRAEVSGRFKDSPLKGKYLERRIDDNTFINLADLIFHNPGEAAYNIDRIVTSLSVPKDGQAVFANLEKTYLYRYVFTKGVPCEQRLDGLDPDQVPNRTIADILWQMAQDRMHPVFKDNTLFENKLLWIARQYARRGIRYVEITDTALARADACVPLLSQAHRVLPAIERETGVTLRFLAGIRRVPLTIVRDRVTPADYLADNLRVIKAIAADPYVAGADIIGEEINDILELREVIAELVQLTAQEPDFVIRIHAGENDCLPDNVANSLKCVREACAPDLPMPHLRIGHGLYTCNLKSAKGQRLLRDLRESGTVLEFQITSNVRLNNLSSMNNHPLKTYLKAGVRCLQGTDGGALYGTDSIDEELALEKMLGLTVDELRQMRGTDRAECEFGLNALRRKQERLKSELSAGMSCADWLNERLRETQPPANALLIEDERFDSREALGDQIGDAPSDRVPVIIAGGSFNNSAHQTRMTRQDKALIDRLLAEADPAKVCFWIGHRLTAYEAYLVRQNQGRFPIHAIVPTMLTAAEIRRLRHSGASVSLSIEASGLSLYKSFSYEIFKRKPSVLLVFDGNSSALNLIQEAKNGRYKCQMFVDQHNRALLHKALSLQGYIHDVADAEAVLRAVGKLCG